MKELKEKEERKVEVEVTDLQARKKEIKHILKKDMRDQSESVKQRLALR